MAYILIIVLVLSALLGPGVWAQHVLKKYAQPENRYTGTGASVARHRRTDRMPGDC
jgi:uncharacterized protein